MDQKIAHYKQLKSLGVDLTQYILNESSVPEKVTKVTGARGEVHLHMGVSNDVNTSAN